MVWVQHERASAPLTHGSAEWQLARGLDAQPDDHYLRKTTPDSFLRTGLHQQLQQWGVGQLVIAGYASEFCIDTTTRSAAAHGYAIILASDAHTTHDKDHASAAQIRAHENATLPKLGSFGVPILTRAAAEIAFPPTPDPHAHRPTHSQHAAPAAVAGPAGAGARDAGFPRP